ncbi:MAG: hypothetical protein LBN37_02340 [Bacteroidales bacterium]|jgi:hypothetical protein|nr:hypothetical protein [Bacteroidales bacterium]
MQNNVFKIKWLSGLIYLPLTVFLFSCTSASQDKLVAKVQNKQLYLNDIKHIFPKDVSKEDSVSLAKLYIEKWVETQLLLNKAELNLSKEQLNISKEIETYRASLLIYKYEEQMLREKMDTIVSDSELKKYYDAYSANFILDEYAVKASYVQIKANAPHLTKVKKWFASDKEKDYQDLVDYCLENAMGFENFNDDWVLWSDVAKTIPQSEEIFKKIAFSNKVEIEENQIIFLLNVKDKRAAGEVAPLAIVSGKIKNIILNKRKVEFIHHLEKNIFNDALSKNKFEIN